MEQKGQEELGSGEGGGREGMVSTPEFLNVAALL